jgi:hypothetical protein
VSGDSSPMGDIEVEFVPESTELRERMGSGGDHTGGRPPQSFFSVI